MDVGFLSRIKAATEISRIELSGWLVDREAGLYLLADHSPENYDHPCRIKIENDGIMYAILASVPSLVGGRSLLFYKSNLAGMLIGLPPFSLLVETMYVEVNRGSGHYDRVDLNQAAVQRYVRERGPYPFGSRPCSSRDWLENL